MNFIEYLKTLFDSFLDGSFERIRIISSLNDAFKEYYYSGELQHLCKVSISTGLNEFRHEMSAMFFRSGFKISIENDSNLKESEMKEISHYVLSNTSFVRQLMSMGFDTLIVLGKNNGKRIAYALKNYASLDNFYIDQR